MVEIDENIVEGLGIKRALETKDIVDGAIVREVVCYAVEARGTIELFASLGRTIPFYTPLLSEPLLEDLYTHLKRILLQDARAVSLYTLGDDEEIKETPEPVDRLHQANGFIEGIRDENIDKDNVCGCNIRQVGRTVVGKTERRELAFVHHAFSTHCCDQFT